jgi:menaquinone-dependent protoporphyrinogen oxidase
MSTILIVYGTTEGHTAMVSEHIADVLKQSGHLVEVLDSHMPSGDLDLGRYDGAIVGASIHAGRHDQQVRDFVKANLSFLERVPSAFFSVSLTAASPKEEDRSELDRLVHQFLEETGWHPDKVDMFAGALLYTQYGLVKRILMKTIVKRAGGDTDTTRDYIYTDWEGVTEFAMSFAATIPQAA